MSEIFSYKFKDSKLLERALTHQSLHKKDNCQTLEFLGDRVTSMIIAGIFMKIAQRIRKVI